MLLFSYAFRMAIANSSATLSTFILEHFCFNGIVSQTTSSSSTLFSIFAYAFPLSTGCVQSARTLLAPFSFNSPAAFASVPPVSQISSINTMSLSVHIPDHHHAGDLICPFPVFVADHHFCIEISGDFPDPVGTSHVGGRKGKVFQL